MIKDRAFSILIEYVPISHSPEALGEMQRIKGYSGPTEGTLLETKWIKPVERHSEGQKSAHLIAKLSSIRAANTAIRDGLVIAGRKCNAQHMKWEPHHCLKCQELNPQHLAASCTGNKRCGSYMGKLFCVNCTSNNHTSWSRLCPKFIEQCRQMEANDPENSYKYFPTDKPWTWQKTCNAPVHIPHLPDLPVRSQI
ncbi:hypothetical protein K439DRAFT_1643810 [Ramaria rubella]|nr:hypothetical protein K439DRAFT_1643810 [Ramaria rubella]